MSNSIETKENMLLHSSLTKDWKNGINHNIPISASFNVLKYINISPSASYTERWYFKRVDQSWDEENNEVKMDTTNGFYRVYNFNVGVSASTKLYGFFIPNRKIFGDKIDQYPMAIDDVVTVSFDIESREWNGRWFTSIRAWKVEKDAPQQPAAPVSNMEPFDGAADNTDDGSGLPF